MRASVLLLVLLAGCTAQAVDPLAGTDPTTPLFGTAGIHLVGAHEETRPDVLVLTGDCRAGRTLAYTFNATAFMNRDEPTVLFESPLEVPNATRFAIAAFASPGPGLAPAWLIKGGSGAVQLNGINPFAEPEWKPDLPTRFTVPLEDGIGRVIIACQGDGPVNYVLGDEARIDSPYYATPVELNGFDVFGAVGTGNIGTIYIPPTAPTFPATWEQAGGAHYTHTEQSPVDGVRMGDSVIQWSAGPGWTTTSCDHTGFHSVGDWAYEATLHGVPRDESGPMVETIATLGLSQQLLSGAIRITHTEEGPEPGHFAFRIHHDASEGMAWTTSCTGVHFGGTLEQAFGTPGFTVWDPPRGVLA